MKQSQISGYYNAVLKAENLPEVPLKFCRVGKGGACVSYVQSRLTGAISIDSVQIDLNRCGDPEYAILHEIAHVIMIRKKNYPGHNAAFRKEEARLVDKYMYSSLTFKYLAS